MIVPKSLIGQWQNELANLFGIEAHDDHTNFFEPGVYLVGREFAGGERGAALLGPVLPFDLVVIDEAHEIFAGLHKRYDRDGIYDEASDEALMAYRVRGFLRSQQQEREDEANYEAWKLLLDQLEGARCCSGKQSRARDRARNRQPISGFDRPALRDCSTHRNFRHGRRRRRRRG